MKDLGRSQNFSIKFGQKFSLFPHWLLKRLAAQCLNLNSTLLSCGGPLVAGCFVVGHWWLALLSCGVSLVFGISVSCLIA